jgi:hypothetical protein
LLRGTAKRNARFAGHDWHRETVSRGSHPCRLIFFAVVKFLLAESTAAIVDEDDSYRLKTVPAIDARDFEPRQVVQE